MFFLTYAPCSQRSKIMRGILLLWVAVGNSTVLNFYSHWLHCINVKRITRPTKPKPKNNKSYSRHSYWMCLNRLQNKREYSVQFFLSCKQTKNAWQNVISWKRKVNIHHSPIFYSSKHSIHERMEWNNAMKVNETAETSNHPILES